MVHAQSDLVFACICHFFCRAPRAYRRGLGALQTLAPGLQDVTMCSSALGFLNALGDSVMCPPCPGLRQTLSCALNGHVMFSLPPTLFLIGHGVYVSSFAVPPHLAFLFLNTFLIPLL